MIPISLRTSYGAQQFELLNAQYLGYKPTPYNLDFVERCKEDLETQTKYLEFFLDDDNMKKKYKMDESNKEGFRIFNEQSDVISVLTYFSEKTK